MILMSPPCQPFTRSCIGCLQFLMHSTLPAQFENNIKVEFKLMGYSCFYSRRIGLQRDIADPRTKSFLYVLDLLPR